MNATALFVCRPDQVIANVRPAWAELSKRRNLAIAGRIRQLIDPTVDELLLNVPDRCLSIKAGA